MVFQDDTCALRNEKEGVVIILKPLLYQFTQIYYERVSNRVVMPSRSGELQVSVEDTSIVIPAHKQQTIFTIFGLRA